MSVQQLKKQMEELQHDYDRYQADMMFSHNRMMTVYTKMQDVQAQIDDLRPLKLSRIEVTPAVKRAIFNRDGYTCMYCGATGVPFEVDHKIPVSRGGSNLMSNLVTACVICNRTKGTMTAREFKAVSNE